MDRGISPGHGGDFQLLTEPVQDAISQHVLLLQALGPLLRRPTADSLAGSRIANLKELRFRADGGVWRLAFAFDGNRIGVLLVAGDKQGKNERRFYKALIAAAEARWSTWA